jgi:hypothetical protein
MQQSPYRPRQKSAAYLAALVAIEQMGGEPGADDAERGV